MKNLILLIAVMVSFSAAANNLVTIERSPVLLELMDTIDISVEAAGAFRFNEREWIVGKRAITTYKTKSEIINEFFIKVDVGEFYDSEEMNDQKRRMAKMMGRPLFGNKFKVVESQGSVQYCDQEFTAVVGKDYHFTLEFAFEN